MDYLSKFWSKFKQEPDIWFFYGFLLTFTLSCRKILFYSPIKGTFNEYTAIYIYISDIFLFFTIISWSFIILSNNINILSIINLWIKQLIHRLSKKIKLELNFLFHKFAYKQPKNINNVPRGTFKKIDFKKKYIYIALPLFFTLYSFISINWSPNKNIAVFRSIKILEYFFLYIYIIFQIVPNCIKKRHYIIKLSSIIIYVSIIHSIIAIIQFINQHSIGFATYIESHISQETPGVAKLFINNNNIIRSYGLFSHPNILAGFLLFSIIITLLYKNLFHVEQKYFLHLKNKLLSNLNVPRGTFINILILIQSIALLLTFSKSAIIGLVITLLYINVPRGTKLTEILNNKTFRSFTLVLIILLLSLYLSKENLYILFIKSLSERILYINVAYEKILSNPLFGIGMGQFVINMSNYFYTLEIWQFQPVHNVFLLIWSELGIVGLALFGYWIHKMFHPVKSSNVPCGTFEDRGANVEQLKKINNVSQKTKSREVVNLSKSILEYKYNNLSSTIILRYFKAILLGFIFIMLFDHYFWDIQQGSILLWIVLGFISGTKK